MCGSMCGAIDGTRPLHAETTIAVAIGSDRSMRSRCERRGQSLVETALVLIPLVLLAVGIVQFGYAFVQLEMIANAARDGARTAAAFPQRDGCGCLRTVDQTSVTASETATPPGIVLGE